MRKIFFIIISVYMSVNCINPVLASYDLATTDNGKRVKLENNGKWFFIEKSKPNIVLVIYDLATTDNGKRVKLENNGKWSFIEESKPNMNSNEVYNDELVRVSFINAELSKEKYNKSIYMKIILKVEAISSTKIIKLNTHRIWGYEDGSDIGGITPDGFYVKDNFNNNLEVSSVSPVVYSLRDKGLRPNETKEFTLKTIEYPINSASFVIININRFVFGNKNNIELKISTEKIKKIETSSAKLDSSNKTSPFSL